MLNLDNFTIILKILINGKISTPFKMDIFKDFAKGNPEIVEPIKKISKLKYSRPRASVEAEIAQRSFVDIPPATPSTPPPPPPVAVKK